MVVLRYIPLRPLHYPSPVAAIGIFDGVHRGHQAILRRAVRRAKAIRGTPMAITFEPHPLAVLAPQYVPTMLLSLNQRLNGFAASGIRLALVVPFTQSFSRWSPEAFVRRVLVERLRVREVVVGHDFGFGVGRSGSIDTLKAFGREFGFRVHVAPPFRLSGKRISSHQIRSIIQKGRVEQAARLLGRPPTVVGRVVRGEGRGAKLGFPTANIEEVEAGVLPPVGVYAVRVRVDGAACTYAGMANLGFRPTFTRSFPRKRESDPRFREDDKPLLEIHLFGVKHPLYGRRLEVAFLNYLRPERRFPSPQALARQLARDARRAGYDAALHPPGGVV